MQITVLHLQIENLAKAQRSLGCRDMVKRTIGMIVDGKVAPRSMGKPYRVEEMCMSTTVTQRR